MRPIIAPIMAAMLAGGGMAGAFAASPPFAFVRKPALLASPVVTVVDTRPDGQCRQATIAGAHCLSPADLLGPHGRLPSFRQINWVLGTAGLAGRGTVVVVGDNPVWRDFMAGMLFLCGQPRVRVMMQPVDALLRMPAVKRGPGRARAILAAPLFTAAARSTLVVFRGELSRSLYRTPPPVLLDGRSEAEYWGGRIRAARGGHIPGARLFPMRLAVRAGMRRAGAPAFYRGAIAYAQDPLTGIAYFTLLRAGLGIAVRVYPGGWRQWAAQPALPADAETYPALPVAAVAATGAI
ncbi:MAG TPA: hypothetical protein DEP05_02340 [Betaproteobacteria bacterium]|nr:hypothetical protein [Betaproteobacteria bacterium]